MYSAGMARTAGAKDIRGRERLNLVRDLAANDMTAEQLAEKYSRHVQSIKSFTERNRVEIDEARRQLAGELSGLWIARKENRIAEYQQKYDDLEGILQDHADTIATLLDAVPDDDAAARAQLLSLLLTHADINRYTVTQLKILASAAEEMGHLPSRTPGEGPSPVILRHEVVGVDLSAALFDPRYDELEPVK